MSYPEALFVCGAMHGDIVSLQSLFVKLSFTDNAIYMGNRGHRLGNVSDVDDYLMARVLGALSRPAVRQRLCVALYGSRPSMDLMEPRRAFAQWWEDAAPHQRYDVMTTAMDRVVIAPGSLFEPEVLPIVVIHWKGPCG